jgi:hypothetical protein
MLAREAVKEAEEIIKPKAKKLKIKLTLQEATEALEETEPVVKKTSRKKNLELEEEGIDITKIKPKTKTTRKKKLGEFEIVGEEEIV